MRLTKLILILLIVQFFTISCWRKKPSIGDSQKQVKTLQIIKNCVDSTIVIKQGLTYQDINWSRELKLPCIGKFAEERHYVTTKDKFFKIDFPKNETDNIASHLKRSFEIYKEYDSLAVFNEVYKNSWNKAWTPSERGECGQGSIGKVQLTTLKPKLELWMLTMMWEKGSKPKIGTKFILRANGKSVVVVAGFETGPASEEYIGGVTCEVHRWLQTNNHSQIEILYPKNQNIPIGPVICKN